MKRKHKRNLEQIPIQSDSYLAEYVSHTYVRNYRSEMADESSRTPEEHAEDALLRTDVKQWVRFLEPESRRVLYLYFGLVSGYQMSIEQVAETVYQTPETVQKMLQDSLLKLKTFAELDGWAPEAGASGPDKQFDKGNQKDAA